MEKLIKSIEGVHPGKYDLRRNELDELYDAYDFFTQNDDGMGQERGELLNRIIPKLEKRDAGYQARWGKIWEDALCQKYKRPDQEEHWIWNFDFYNGPVEDLRYIAALIGA